MSKSNKERPLKKLVQRREFLSSVATMAGASSTGRGAGSPLFDPRLLALC